MKLELPEFKRCCLCIPLSYGILVWGYLKLSLAIILLALSVYQLTINPGDTLNNSSDNGTLANPGDTLDDSYDDGTLGVVHSSAIATAAIAIVEMIFSTILIVGKHMKIRTLLFVYYVYSWFGSIVLLAVTIVSMIDFIYRMFNDCLSCKITPLPFFLLVLTWSISCCFLLIHFYLTMVLRTAIMKGKVENVLEFINVELNQDDIYDENEGKHEVYKPCSSPLM